MAIVVIDAGHGGKEKVGGSSPNNATSPSGLLEKNLTLAVARHAETALLARGHTVRLTRTTDVNLGLADRAAVSKTVLADALVSIHFNGFGDPSVQGTETWVHQTSSARSRDLAGCVQRAVLQATRYRDRGVQAKVLGVLDAVHLGPQTAACLAELSFITTTAEDTRLHDPAYLQSLGEAVASGIHEFAQRPVAPVLETLAGRRAPARDTSGGVGVPAVLGRRLGPIFQPRSAVALESIAAPAISAQNPVLTDIRRAIDAMPKKKGIKTKQAGPVQADGDGNTHIQGLAGYKDFFLLTHSDKSQPAGRILIVDRRPPERRKVGEFPLPPAASGGPSLFHAGGCQMIGDVLVVPSESGDNASMVAFFDVSDPLNIRELHESLRIPRKTRDAAAAGITTITRDGQPVWLCAVYDSGSVDFYESPDLPNGVPFKPVFVTEDGESRPLKVTEKHHQTMLLFTDPDNRIFAAGLNRGFTPSFNRLVLYVVDLVGQSMTADPDRSFSTDAGLLGFGTSLRWGATLETVGDRLVLHCTERSFGKSCDINTFDTAPVLELAAIAGRRSRRRKPAKKRATGKGKARKTTRRRRKRK
jgi:N-acetylmuramoyl-L-alanine amidase